MAELADALADQVAQLSLRGYGTAEEATAAAVGARLQQWQAPGTPAESIVAGMDAALQSLRELIGGTACIALGIFLVCSVLLRREQQRCEKQSWLRFHSGQVLQLSCHTSPAGIRI